MQHLVSTFKSLANAIYSNHSQDEIRGFAISLQGAALRILEEHKEGGLIRDNLLKIYKLSKNIEHKASLAGKHISQATHSHLPMPEKPTYYIIPYWRRYRLNDTLSRIQQRIKAIANELKIEFEEVTT